MYVDDLIGRDTVNTLPKNTLEAFVDHGTVARTIDNRVEDALAVMGALSMAGVDMEDVGRTLEVRGIAAFDASVAHVLSTLEAKARAGGRQRGPVPVGSADGEPQQE
jgi:transaldolase